MELPRPFGPYVLLKSLGTGGTGDVFLARPETEGSPLVIKRLHLQLANQPDFVRRFQHEAEIAMAIDSPHLAKVYDAGRIDETFYIAMEYLAGWTVARVIKDLTEAGGTASISSIADVARGALRGLAALHRATDPKTGASLGIIHRDIAPKNLMIGEDGITRLIDLGLGKSNLQDWRTGTGVVMGSPGYMAPEQVVAEGVDQRSDLYAMGIVLWEFLTLKRFIKRAPIPIMLRAQVQPKFTLPSQSRSDVPRALDLVCQKALELEPADRYQTAEEFIAALDEAVPARDEEEPLATIVNDMLWGELGQAKTEVTKLLSLLPSDRPQSIEVRPIEPTVARVSPIAIEPASEPTPMAFSTQENLLVAPAPSGVPVKGVIALMALTLLIGLGGGALLLREEPRIEARPLPPPSIEAPQPAVAPAVVVAPEPVVHEEPPPPIVEKRRAIKKVPKVETTAEPSPRPRAIDPPAASDRDRLLALMQRARTLRTKVAGTPKEGEVTGVLAKAAQEASAKEINAAVLRELESALKRIEAN